MKKYKFVDIGCGLGAVSTDKFGLNETGLLVEPISEYCKLLPSSDTVNVECAAIGEFDGTQQMKIMIPSGNISYIPSCIWNSEKALFRYLKKNNLNFPYGRSSFNDNENLKDAVTRDVKVITLNTLVKKYNISEIDYLKIDVEGYEHIVLEQLLDLMTNGTLKINKEIKFEYNHLSNLKELDVLRDTICDQFNFEWKFENNWINEDIILEKKSLI